MALIGFQPVKNKAMKHTYSDFFCTFAPNNPQKMKRLSVLLYTFFLSFNTFAQEWIGISHEKPQAPVVELIACSEQSTTIKLSLGGFYQECVSTPKGIQYTISVPRMASMLEEGSPDLPLFSIPIVIDRTSEMEVIVTDAQYHDYQDIGIAPSKGNLSRETNPEDVPFWYGNPYFIDDFYPSTPALLDQPYILRDIRGQNILVYPFAYNPVKKVLRVYTSLTLTIRKSSNNGVNPKISQRPACKLSAETNAMYTKRFINYPDTKEKYPFIPDIGEMLVICPQQYMDAMQPFVSWKNNSGRPTTIVNLSNIGGNNAEQIKAYIQDYYNHPEHNLCFVLLVGDYNDLTPKMLNIGGSDIWFGQLEGNDFYPEVLVGRFSAESVADVENQVAKVIHYERDITADNDWLGRAIGIGSSEGGGSGHNGGESDYQHIEYIRDTLLHYTYSEVSQHYAGIGAGTNAAMLSENFNTGAGLCNYCNHGSTTSWYVGSFSNSHINALENEYRWPVIWSTACLNGKFDVTCFAEAWMRATNHTTGRPTGAIGGMFSWTSQPWQPPMTGQDEMVNILCEWRNSDNYHHTLGGASLNGNMHILDLHPTDQGFTHNTWILFGDPSLLLRTTKPEPMNVACQPEAIFLGQRELRISTDIDYAWATLSINDRVVASTPITNGEATLTFESPDQEGTAQLVVTSFNKVSLVRTLQIIPAEGAYLAYDNYAINNANGQAEYGQDFTIDMTIKNIGSESASNVIVSLSTNSTHIDILEGNSTLPNIEALEHITIEDCFRIKVGDSIEDGTQAEFTLKCHDGTHTWTSNFRMTLHAPKFALSDFRTETNVFPGQSGLLNIGILNCGTADAHNACIKLYSSSTDIIFSQASHHIGDIPAGQTSSLQIPFSTTNDITIGSSFETMYIFEAESYQLVGKEFLNIGSVKETFETGDLNAFDWQTLGGAQWHIDNSTAHSGIYSVKSGGIGHANLTTLQVSVDVTTDGQISFYKKICSEANKDKLTFYIDSQIAGTWSGEIDWSHEIFNVTAGTHTFKWIYMKDSSGSYGDDACWIDDIQFPAATIIEMLAGPELRTFVDQQMTCISWESLGMGYEYIIYRDGNYVTTTAGTSFSETLPSGTYLYCIVGKVRNTLTAPSFAHIQIDPLCLEESINQINIYPNPTHGIIRIETMNIQTQPMPEYRICNLMGQEITNGKINGSAQIDIRGQAKGIYIMQIVSNGKTITKKIAVQ